MNEQKPEFKPEDMTLDQLFAEMIESAKSQKVLEFIAGMRGRDNKRWLERSEEVSNRLIACMSEIRRRVNN